MSRDKYLISGPSKSKNCTIPEDVLQFDFSYGYSCRKPFNLVVLDPFHVAFASGNYIHFLNTETKSIWFRRSALGGGIGHIRKNPQCSHFAVAENGKNPVIFIYEWPSLDLICSLNKGAERTYSSIDFSADGQLLVSQSGQPDYLITVWNWKQQHIVLRGKSFDEDVYRVKFSPYIPSNITTCGKSHIKFWTMAPTFTGLKLKGEIGRFGTTEFSDILGVFPMPDGKVVSGCSWGNILIWEEGLIAQEVFRSQNRHCHEAPVVQFHYNEGELWSVSMDGHIRVWWYQRIDQEDDKVVLLDPSYDFYTPGAMWSCIEKKEPQRDGGMDQFYGQDGNGGIWLLDLNTESITHSSELLYKCHAGEVVDVACCPFNTYLLSFGMDGRIYVYNYIKRELVYHIEFPARGTCMIWPPLSIVQTGDIILTASDDGQVRVIQVSLEKEIDISIKCIQLIKPHAAPITQMSMNREGTVLVTGAEDSTIFILKVIVDTSYKLTLEPIGFVPTPDVVTCIAWNSTATEVLVGCLHGQMMQVLVPDCPQAYTEVSYSLQVKPKFKNFTTCKSWIRQNVETTQESREKLEPISKFPNKILWLMYTGEGTIWVSMRGYDAGYIYEFFIDQKEDMPYRFKEVDDSEDMEISSYIYNSTGEYLIFAMQDGSIRINKTNPEDFRDLSNHWTLTMHDNQDGFIPKMCFSFDEKYFFSCGHDGNVFAYKFQSHKHVEGIVKVPRGDDQLQEVVDSDGYKKLSLEQMKLKEEHDRLQTVANERKAGVIANLKTLKELYENILQRNSALLPSQIIHRSELELDQKVLQHINGEFDDKLQLIKKKLAYDLEKSSLQMRKLLGYLTEPLDMHALVIRGFNDPNVQLNSFRQRKLSKAFYNVLEEVETMVVEEEVTAKSAEKESEILMNIGSDDRKTPTFEYFLINLQDSEIQGKLGGKLKKILEKYRMRQNKWKRRKEEWNGFMALKPQQGRNHPDDEKFLLEATRNIGDYKLKENDDPTSTPEFKDTAVRKYKEILDTSLKQYKLKHNFTKRVWDIRDVKYNVREILLGKSEQLQRINMHLPSDIHNFGPIIPEIDESEFPEKKLEPKVIVDGDETIEVGVEQKIIYTGNISDEILELFQRHERYPEMANQYFVSRFTREDFIKICKTDFEEIYETPEEVATPFEVDVRITQLNKLLISQQDIIASMRSDIDHFNAMISRTENDRLPVVVDTNFLDLFVLTLNQELNILQRAEVSEKILEGLITDGNVSLRRLEGEGKVLEAKKKSIEQEMQDLQNEENIVEKNRQATETVYHLTVSLCSRRSSTIQKVTEQIESLELVSQNIDALQHKRNELQAQLNNFSVELNNKKRQKQNDLNKVKCTVILSMDQIFECNLDRLDIDQFLLFSKTTLSNLYVQVGTLKSDNFEQKGKYNAYLKHLMRMKKDIDFMKMKVSNLKNQIRRLMLERFGTKIDVQDLELAKLQQHFQKYIDELEEVALKELVYKLRFKLTDFQTSYHRQLQMWSTKISNAQQDLIKAIQENTQKLELMQIISKEKRNLIRITLSQPKKRACVEKIEESHLKNVEEIEKLENILSNQERRLEELRREIKILKTKGITTTNKLGDNSGALFETGEGQSGKESIDFDKYIQEDFEVERVKDECSSEDMLESEEMLEERRSERVLQEIKIPRGYSTEGTDLVRIMLEDFFKNLNLQLDSKSEENILEDILNSVLNHTSVSTIMQDIINKLPIQLSEEQTDLVEEVAKRLYCLQEMDNEDESYAQYINTLLESTIKSSMANRLEPHYILVMISKVLIESIPEDRLMEENCIQIITSCVKGNLEDAMFKDINEEGIYRVIEEEIPEAIRVDIMNLLSTILEKIFNVQLD